MERWKKEIQDEMARQNVDLFGTGTITITVPVTQLERIPIMLKHNLHVGNNWRILAV